jgi:stage II sporulation protein P
MILVLYVAATVAYPVLPPAKAAAPAPISLYLNGNKLKPPVAPRLASGTTLVPARTVAEALGASLAWNPASRTVTISRPASVIVLRIGQKSASVNGSAVKLDAAPAIVGGTTLVPVRFIAETFGVSVDWVGADRSVRLWTSGIDSASVLIYHSHNRESFVPLLGVTSPDEAYDAKQNIGLLGDRLVTNLKKRGAAVYHTKDDYPALYGSSFRVGQSYEYSAATVKKMLAAHPQIRYLIDLHRDADTRERTTVTIQGTTYARLYFVIGKDNPNWKQNDALARKLQSLVERQYPGLSRGIVYKDRSTGNGVYNQNLSPRSALIELGGAYNTVEECNRTIDILAGAILEVMTEGF